MKFPVSWLNRYVDAKVSPEKIAELLTMSGTAVERVEKHGSDSVIEVEITTNRPDCLSLVGIARELGAITGKKVTDPLAKLPKTATAKVDVRVEDKKGCPMYTAALLRDVAVRGTPENERRWLELSGVRSISSVVDATNFALLETGQPLHAFDYDKLAGGRIEVRRAKKGEKFLGLDGVEYTLDPETLVIADAEKPVALAGIIGGKLTEVTASTKNVLLESALFDARLVRKTSKKYKISTESSYRFERGVNPETVSAASRRAAALILAWGGRGTATTPFEKKFFTKTPSPRIRANVSKLNSLLGLQVTPARVKSIFKSLGFVVAGSGTVLTVTPGPGRRDVRLEADLAEEVLRVEGFDKVPVAIPPTQHGQDVRDRNAARTIELKKFLAAAGLNEVVTYSLLSEKALLDSGFHPASASRIANAVSAEQQFLRPSLLPGMLGAAIFNVHRKAVSLKLFEIGRCYRNGSEEAVLGILFYGNAEDHWRRRGEMSIYELKGAAERVLAELRVHAFEWVEEPNALFDQAVSLVIRGQKIGSLGKVSTAAQTKWDLPRELFFAEFSLEALLLHASATVGRLTPVPKFPSVRRDVALVVDEKTPVAELVRVMREAACPHLRDVALFDEYKGKNIASGKRSLAFSLAYQKDTGTFTDDEIQVLQAKVGEALRRAGAEFRA